MNPKAYCRKYKLKPIDFARRMGLSKSMVSRLFNSGPPLSLKSAIKIEEMSGGEIKRTDVRPDLRPISRKQRVAAADQPANQGADNAATEA